MTTAFYRYVSPSVIPEYEALGWLDLGPTAGHHGHYSNTLVFRSDEWEDPPEPGKPGTRLLAARPSLFQTRGDVVESAERAAHADLLADFDEE